MHLRSVSKYWQAHRLRLQAGRHAPAIRARARLAAAGAAAGPDPDKGPGNRTLARNAKRALASNANPCGNDKRRPGVTRRSTNRAATTCCSVSEKPQFQLSNSSGHHHCLLFCDKPLANTTIGAQYLDTRQRPATEPHETAGVGRTRLPADAEVMASPAIRTLTLLSQMAVLPKALLYPLFERTRRGYTDQRQTFGHAHALSFMFAS